MLMYVCSYFINNSGWGWLMGLSVVSPHNFHKIEETDTKFCLSEYLLEQTISEIGDTIYHRMYSHLKFNWGQMPTQGMPDSYAQI